MTYSDIHTAVQMGFDAYTTIANSGDVDATQQAAAKLQELRDASLVADTMAEEGTLTEATIQGLRDIAGEIEVMSLMM